MINKISFTKNLDNRVRFQKVKARPSEDDLRWFKDWIQGKDVEPLWVRALNSGAINEKQKF